MRFRLGCLLGFASGYYLGTRAGRARYDQLNRMLAKVRRTDAYETASGKAKDLVDDGVERAKDLVEDGVARTKDLVDEGVERTKDLVDEGVERASELVEEHRSTDDVEEGPIAVTGSDLDPTVADLSPGPPPAGSLSDEPRR